MSKNFKSITEIIKVYPSLTDELISSALKRGLLIDNDDGLIDLDLVSDFVNKPKHPFTILTDSTPCNYSVVELFAGAGGLALGFHNAGISSSLLVEMDKHACATLRQNFRGAIVFEGDATVASYKGSADIVAGGFPCQAFSFAGKKLGFQDIRGTLFFQLARAVSELNPKVVIGENVKGLLSHDDGKTFKVMVDVLDELGYNVKYKLLKSQFFDVAQKRERVVVVGIRKDLPFDKFEFPEERSYVIRLESVLDNVPNSKGVTYSAEKKKIMDKVPEGGNWRDLPLIDQKSYMGGSFEQGGGKTGIAKRLSRFEPSLTLVCTPAQKQTERCHPTETRPLTVREYARIQSFPDSWEFCGSMTSQYKQIGNAVPVNLGFHIAMSVKRFLQAID